MSLGRCTPALQEPSLWRGIAVLPTESRAAETQPLARHRRGTPFLHSPPHVGPLSAARVLPRKKPPYIFIDYYIIVALELSFCFATITTTIAVTVTATATAIAAASVTVTATATVTVKESHSVSHSNDAISRANAKE